MIEFSGFFNTRQARLIWAAIPAAILLCWAIMMFWLNHEPELFDPAERSASHAAGHGHALVTGYTTTATLIETAEVLLNKRGGYLSNDIMPPWVFLDNVPNWEFGVLTQVRDLARAMRNDLSRSQTQSTEDLDLSKADPLFHYDSERWFPPDTEGRYRKANAAMEAYLTRLSSPARPEAQFYARADNLTDWLAVVEKRLGSLSQRLSASVGQVRLNTDLSGDADARQSTNAPSEVVVKTPWTEIDDVFYQARGTAWALVLFLHAMETDFDAVLRKKNAQISFRQIIRELESALAPIHAPMVLNGSQFGLFANHSLIMANYISRANAAIIDLRQLLQDG
ncbi:MAG TPA: DUF2333 family protein [Xanthomonadales bacterium]|nr:DUF2333 family protein [Xanthomonadales bacterium]